MASKGFNDIPNEATNVNDTDVVAIQQDATLSGVKKIKVSTI